MHCQRRALNSEITEGRSAPSERDPSMLGSGWTSAALDSAPDFPAPFCSVSATKLFLYLALISDSQDVMHTGSLSKPLAALYLITLSTRTVLLSPLFSCKF